MKRSLGRWWRAVLGAAAVGASACTNACPQTHLDVTLHGGFGYVINPDLTVEAGFMKSIDADGCTVKQLGVELTIDDGQILSSGGLQTPIDVTNSVVTFEGVGTDAVAFNGVLASSFNQINAASSAATATAMSAASRNGPSGKQQPSPRAGDDDWEDLYWLPHTRLNFSDKPIDPAWRTNAVTGRAVLSGGTLSAGVPSDGAAVNGLWEFKTKKGVVSHKQSITDRLHYRRTFFASHIVIDVADANGLHKIDVAPLDNRRTVGIILKGRHASQMPPKLNEPLEHFCTFYQLIQPGDRPAADDRLMPYFIGNGVAPTLASLSSAQPTPGYFCPGDVP